MTLPEWIDENKDEVLKMQEFATSDLPENPVMLALDLSRAARYGARAGFMLAEAESFVLKAHAAAVVEVRHLHSSMTAEERRVMAKAEPTYLQVVLLRDNLAVIVSSLKTRCYVSMNARRSYQIHPGAQEG